DHYRRALRPLADHDEWLRDVREMPRGVRRPHQPPLSRAANRVPRVRATTLAPRRNLATHCKREPSGRVRPRHSEWEDRRAQRAWWLSPRVRRAKRAHSGGLTPPETPR